MTLQSRPQYLAPSGLPSGVGPSVQTAHSLAQAMRQVDTLGAELSDRLKNFQKIPQGEREDIAKALGFDCEAMAEDAERVLSALPGKTAKAKQSSPKATKKKI